MSGAWVQPEDGGGRPNTLVSESRYLGGFNRGIASMCDQQRLIFSPCVPRQVAPVEATDWGGRLFSSLRGTVALGPAPF